MTSRFFTAQTILSALFPTLIESARYAHLIQKRIHAHDVKHDASNIFAAALSDADLSIQTHVELALLANFPELPFFGEEWKSSHNTKYLSGTNFIDEPPLLVALDPIDGTRPYLDGHALYQIILSVLSPDAFEGVMVLFPAYGDYVYALRGKGAYRGTFDTPLTYAESWKLKKAPRRIYLSSDFVNSRQTLSEQFEVACPADYSKDRQDRYFSALLRGELCGGIMSSAQVIDGAALAFVAQEMGCVVETLDGKKMPRPGDFPDLILPGLVAAENAAAAQILRSALA